MPASHITSYPIEPERDFFLSVPGGALFLGVITRDGDSRLYFKIPADTQGLNDFLFYVIPTGADFRPCEETATFVANFTVRSETKTLTFHLFTEPR